MPTARLEVGGAVLNGKIYVIGGYNENGVRTDVVQPYDPQTDRWSKASPLIEPVDHSARCVLQWQIVCSWGLRDFSRSEDSHQ